MRCKTKRLTRKSNNLKIKVRHNDKRRTSHVSIEDVATQLLKSAGLR